MEIIELNEKASNHPKALTLVIGKFDGVHKGHQAILQTAKSYMDEANELLAVMSFSAHPLWVLKQKEEFKHKLTPDNQKLHLLKQFGVSRCYWIEFTKEYAKTTAEQFVNEHLAPLHVNRIVVGEGFRFGAGGLSSTDELIQLCNEKGIEVIVVPLVKVNGEKISGRSIRKWVELGLMEPVHAVLGRPFTVTGKVIHGQKMGRKLGFPTVNLGDVDDYVNPKPGVYLGQIGIHNEKDITEYYDVLISAGYRPTVSGKGYLIEAYLLNYSGDLYDKTVSVTFLRYMRDEVKFTELDDLVKQMEKDKIDGERLMGH
ncbi:bifunctional riboflavin kinase/FAD synthetase [Aquibacillus salsiterrae]|uniref:Riboflavin biosynthesis protein n=1 Tax=Aquibacillus salsiterrae TaxID=2950439 RepID=A0A9X3WEW3_9BACI|nr:bifunctional riboflavin kinase/FAD synthetase [Aquibacillus salsiterrae]MDC3417423.1 bifunctional riboflavin kinase/FAD synthetase [Aquibacillus salsiterrae]